MLGLGVVGAGVVGMTTLGKTPWYRGTGDVVAAVAVFGPLIGSIAVVSVWISVAGD